MGRVAQASLAAVGLLTPAPLRAATQQFDHIRYVALRAPGPRTTTRAGLSDRRAQPAGGDQTYGVVVVTATKPSRSRIGRLSGEAST